MLTSRDTLLQNLEGQVSKCDQDAQSIQEQAEALEKRLATLKGEVNDLVHAHPAIMKTLRESGA